jgi:hypothetical protein
MKLSVALSVGAVLMPEIASAAGGFYQSCKNTVCASYLGHLFCRPSRFSNLV